VGGILGEKVNTAVQAQSARGSNDFLFTAFSSTSKPTVGHQWLLDSGCSAQITGTREGFTSYVQIPDGEHKIRVTNNAGISALGRGDVALDV